MPKHDSGAARHDEIERPAALMLNKLMTPYEARVNGPSGQARGLVLGGLDSTATGTYSLRSDLVQKKWTQS